MSWYTDRSPTGEASVRAWRPPALTTPEPGDWGRKLDSSPLAFDEADLARAAAASSIRAVRDAQAAADVDQAARQVQALEQVASALGQLGQRRAADEQATLERLVTLARAIARVTGPAGADARVLAERVAEMLAGGDAAAPRRLLVSPGMAEALRPLLHEIAVEIGFKGSLELEADPRLPDGAAQLLWPGGWLELDPSALASRVSDLLAPYGGTATRSPQAEDRTTDEHEPG